MNHVDTARALVQKYQKEVVADYDPLVKEIAEALAKVQDEALKKGFPVLSAKLSAIQSNMKPAPQIKISPEKLEARLREVYPNEREMGHLNPDGTIDTTRVSHFRWAYIKGAYDAAEGKLTTT